MRPRRGELADRDRGTADTGRGPAPTRRSVRASSFAAQIELVGTRVVRRVSAARDRAGQRKRQRLDDPPRDVVLQPEQIAQRRLNRLRRQQRSARRFDELRRGAQLIAGSQQRAHDDAIDVGFRGQGLEVGCVAGEARCRGARAHDERADTGQRRRDRIRQAERQEVGLRIGPQDAKRQHDDPRERSGPSRVCRRCRCHRTARSSSAICAAEGGRPRGAWQARAG